MNTTINLLRINLKYRGEGTGRRLEAMSYGWSPASGVTLPQFANQEDAYTALFQTGAKLYGEDNFMIALYGATKRNVLVITRILNRIENPVLFVNMRDFSKRILKTHKLAAFEPEAPVLFIAKDGVFNLLYPNHARGFEGHVRAKGVDVNVINSSLNNMTAFNNALQAHSLVTTTQPLVIPVVATGIPTASKRASYKTTDVGKLPLVSVSESDLRDMLTKKTRKARKSKYQKFIDMAIKSKNGGEMPTYLVDSPGTARSISDNVKKQLPNELTSTYRYSSKLNRYIVIAGPVARLLPFIPARGQAAAKQRLQESRRS